MSFEEQVADLMDQHKLKMDDSRRNVILVIGRSGVGKSAITEVIFGDLEALEAVRESDMLYTKIKNTKTGSGKEEHSMFQSDTVCPQLFTDPTEPDIAIYDCPGFADTRGTSNEIATGVYLSEIISHAEQVKLVATVDYDTVKPNADRNKFTDTILPEVLEFVAHNDIYKGGVFLLVTKYANPNEDPNNKFDDDEIIRGIACFLKEAQSHAARNLRDRSKESALNALFDKSWFRKEDSKYTNIAFSRTITVEGKLSDMEDLTRRTEIRNKLLHNPLFVFKPSDSTHFGCPITDAAKLEIRKVQKSLSGDAEVLLRTVGQKVINKFVEASKDHKQLADFVHKYLEFLNDMQKLDPSEAGLTIQSLSLLRKFGSSIAVDTEAEMDQLHDKVQRIKYLSGVDVEESSAVWKDAHEKLNQAKANLGKDLLIEFRKTCRDLASNANLLLTLIGQRVVIKCAKSTGNAYFDKFKAFSEDLEALKGEDKGLNQTSLELLCQFGNSIGTDVSYDVDKLTGIISCFQNLTGVDVQQSSATWAEVHLKWDHLITFMEKDIDQLKAKRDFAQAEIDSKLALAAVEAQLADAKNKEELTEARRLIAVAEAEAQRVKAEHERKMIAAEHEKENARLKAKEEMEQLRREAEYLRNRNNQIENAKQETSSCSIL